MTPFKRVLADLRRYNARWHEMHVIDLATWLVNWESELIFDLYIDAMVEKKLAGSLAELATASKIYKAAYVAMPGHLARRVIEDPYVRILIDVTVREREQARSEHKEAVRRLVGVLRQLLPDKYNNNGG